MNAMLRQPDWINMTLLEGMDRLYPGWRDRRYGELLRNPSTDWLTALYAQYAPALGQAGQYPGQSVRRDGPTMGRLSLGIAGRPATIAPGETRTIEVAVTLPEPPPPNGRYRARVPLLNATLNIIVTPSGATHEPSYEEHARNTRAASTPARRKR